MDNNIYCPTARDSLQVDEYEACCKARFDAMVKEFDLSRWISLERLLLSNNNIYFPTERDSLQVDNYEAYCKARVAARVKEFDLSR